jgi:hypothetical protein
MCKNNKFLYCNIKEKRNAYKVLVGKKLKERDNCEHLCVKKGDIFKTVPEETIWVGV